MAQNYMKSTNFRCAEKYHCLPNKRLFIFFCLPFVILAYLSDKTRKVY